MGSVADLTPEAIMVSIKVLAAVLLVAFVAVDAEMKRCTVDELKEHQEHIGKAKEHIGTLESKVEEVYNKLEEDGADCEEIEKSLPPAFEFFAMLAKKGGDCKPDEVEEEEEEQDELFDEGGCPQEDKKLLKMVECGVDKFSAKLDGFNDQLENADGATDCEDIAGSRTVMKGVFLLNHLEMSK